MWTGLRTFESDKIGLGGFETINARMDFYAVKNKQPHY